MIVRLTLTAFYFVIFTTAAHAQQCRDGVCRIPNGFEPSAFGQRDDDRRSLRPARDPRWLNSETNTAPAWRYEADGITYRDDGHLAGQLQPERYELSRFDARPQSRSDNRLNGVEMDRRQACRNCDCNQQFCVCGASCPDHRPGTFRGRPTTNLLQDVRPQLYDRPVAPAARDRSQFRPVSYQARSGGWQNNFQQAVNVSQQTGRPLLVKVGADWCGYCRRMDQETFANHSLMNRLSNDFITVQLNADQNRELMQRMRIRTLPTVLVMTPDLTIAQRTEGFRTAEQLGRTLHPYLQRADIEADVQVADLR
jgi:thiol-disulfide isomerase/thioredoxin